MTNVKSAVTSSTSVGALAHETVIHALCHAALHMTLKELVNELVVLAMADIDDPVHEAGTPGNSLDTAVRSVVWAVRNLPHVTVTTIDVLDGVIDDMPQPRTVAEWEVKRATLLVAEAFATFATALNDVVSANLRESRLA